MTLGETIYDEFGVRRVINGVGTRTQVSGARLRPGVAAAMERAADAHVYMADLQAAASDVIAEATGAEAGYVTPGAAAGMQMAAAACLAGNDFAKMAKLPDTSTMPNKIVIPKAHRIKYDVGIRASGAQLVDVGHVSHHPIAGGVDRVEPWELEAAITEETVAVAYVERPHNTVDLAMVVEIAHEHDLPVIMDAASEIPPPSNLRRYIDMGVDLVAYSGGKGIGGPQPSGFVAGRRELVQSIALQHLPDGYHEDLWRPPTTLIDRSDLSRGTPATNLGRPLKVGPEEIIGLLTALQSFLEEDHDATLAEWRNRADRISTGLAACPVLAVSLSDGMDKASGVPKVKARVHDNAPITAIELIGSLREEDPRVWLGERRVHLEEFTVSPVELTDDEANYLVERVLAHLE